MCRKVLTTCWRMLRGIEGVTAAARARTLLKETGVASVAGSAFYMQKTGMQHHGRATRGEELLRFCFAKKDEDLAEACRRLRARG